MPQNRAKFHFDNEYTQQPIRLGPYMLVQAGDLKCEPGYQVLPHQQWVDEISLVIAGEATFEADDKEYNVPKGMMFLSGRHEVHAIRSSKSNPMRMLYLAFDFVESAPDSFALLKQFFDRPDRRLVHGTLEVQQAYMRLLTETLQPDALSSIVIESCMHQIICSAYRLCHGRRRYVYGVNDPDSTSDKLAYDVLNYLDTRQDYGGKLSELSREFGYSYAHIAQKFAALTGENLKAYHTKLRFDQAQNDMMSGRSITETAERMGYKSIHAFSRAFKKYTGITAREFIRRVRENYVSTPL